MTFTNYLADEMLDHMFGKQTFTPSTTLYVGLATNVTVAGVITGEPSTGLGYNRVPITNDNTTSFWSPSTNKTKLNGSGAITFPTVLSTTTQHYWETGWGTMTKFFISDGSTGGNIWGYGPLTANIAPKPGMVLKLDPGAIWMSI